MAEKSGKRYKTFEEIETILDKYSDFEKIRLSGGEPFEHPLLEDTLGVLKKKNKIVTILSCGVKGDEVISEQTFSRIKPFVNDIVFSYQGYYDEHKRIVTSNNNYLKNKRKYIEVENGLDFSAVYLKESTNLQSLDRIVTRLREEKASK